MNNLGQHVKSFYPDNYKMDLGETMKAALSKGPSSGGSVSGSSSSGSVHSNVGEIQQAAIQPGVGYVTEKLYMLLQLYLQNKGWNPSVELLQCFAELKDSAMLPSAAYLQVLANRLTLDSQGRLILRENGKIVLPFEHFANAVMLKHMSGPHGLHLSVDATVRAVLESYTIGRENFGMEKDFIVEVVQSCPSPACRYYKNHMGIPPMSFLEQSYPGVSPEFLQHLPPPPPQVLPPQPPQQQSTHSAVVQSLGSEIDLSKNQKLISQMHLPPPPSPSPKQQQQSNHPTAISLQQQQQLQQQQLMQHQSRALAQQNMEKFGNLSAIDKQRVLQQFDKKHYESQQNVVTSVAVAGSAANNIGLQGIMQNSPNHQQSPSPHLQPPTPSTPNMLPQDNNQKNDLLRSNLESLESNKDLLALHNGAWGESRDGVMIGQDKIVRAFSELMRNMARMKTFIRPSMCKPYGKQSESLQKTLMDTLQLVQSLRSFLPAPHIPVSSWKSEGHRKDTETTNSVENLN